MINYPSIFAFGLVAYGFLCMGPVNIAVDSYGPVTDNAQSIFELAQTETIPGIKEEIKKDFGFEPNFEMGKHYLEANDSAGNTFKATAKPVLIGTAVVGATTMIFSIILLLQSKNMLQCAADRRPDSSRPDLRRRSDLLVLPAPPCRRSPPGPTGRSSSLRRTWTWTKKEADIEDSKTVVKICTQYAQKGMWNIFIAPDVHHARFRLLEPELLRRLSDLHRRASACSRPSTWPTPAAPGTMPRRWSKSI